MILKIALLLVYKIKFLQLIFTLWKFDFKALKLYEQNWTVIPCLKIDCWVNEVNSYRVIVVGLKSINLNLDRDRYIEPDASERERDDAIGMSKTSSAITVILALGQSSCRIPGYN